MMGRVRSKARAGWPDNLYPNRDGFKYRHPITRKETWMGRDRVKAFAAAKRLNTLLMPGGALVDRVVAQGESVADAIRIFRQDDVPGRCWAPKTAEVYESVINRIDRTLGELELTSLTVKDCATFFRTVTESARSRQQFRLVLGWILACAVEEGWMENNPALVTRKFHHERQRERLTMEIFQRIWEKAPGWLQNAMDLSLITLLRREDVATCKFSDVRDDKLSVVPLKTQGTTGVRLRFAVDGDLAALLARARDNVASPYVIHRLPEKARPQHMRATGRDHHTQLLPEQVSRGFAEAREEAKIGGTHPPTFHEIRSLGAALLREQGCPDERIQALMGHSDVQQTQEYLGGHEVPWTEVQTGVHLKR